MGVKNWFSGLMGGKPPPDAQVQGGGPFPQAPPPQQWQQPGFAPPGQPSQPGQMPSGPMQPGYPQPGYAGQQPGHPQPGPMQSGYPQPGYPQHPGQPFPAPYGAPSPEASFDPASIGEHFDRAGEMVDREASVPPAQWRDDFGPLRADQAEEFFVHMMEIEQSAQNPPEQRQRAGQLGYRDFVHWHRTRLTFLKYTGEGDPNGPLSRWAFSGERAMQLMMAASMKQHRSQTDGGGRGGADLLAPIEGVTIERYAELAAAAARSRSQAELTQLLGRYGIDRDKYDRVSKAWISRMSTDTTATLATIYGKAFSGPQANPASPSRAGGSGQRPAAGAEGRDSEPVPFEKYCELCGALAAWTKQKKDVSAMMREKFRMGAADFSNVSSYWMRQAMADSTLLDRQQKLTQVYEELYTDPDPDADIVY